MTSTWCESSPVIVHYLLQLPVEITRCIFHEYLKGQKLKYSLLQTTRNLHLLRKQIIYLKINLNESYQFYFNRQYRERVLSCIENPQYQLHLVFDQCYLGRDWSASPAIDLSVILPVHRLQIFSFPEMINFHLIERNKLDFLEIVGCKSFIDIELCKGITTLSLINCPKIVHINKLSNVKTLKLCSCPINPWQWSLFSTLQVFELTDCQSITDVSALAHIHNLTLQNCPNVTNIDVLTHCNRLCISYCHGIEDVSLSDHPRDEVTLKNNYNLLKVTIAGKVRKIQLDNLRYLLQLSLLDYVDELVIEEAHALISLDSVQYVQTLSLVRCAHLVEISPLLQVKSLEIEECDSIKSIKSLNYLESIAIYYSEDLQSIEDLPLLTTLKVSGCLGLERIVNLPLCKNYELFFEELEVINCPGYIKLTPD